MTSGRATSFDAAGGMRSRCRQLEKRGTALHIKDIRLRNPLPLDRRAAWANGVLNGLSGQTNRPEQPGMRPSIGPGSGDRLNP